MLISAISKYWFKQFYKIPSSHFPHKTSKERHRTHTSYADTDVLQTICADSAWLVGCWLCWGLTSQSTIFQSCRDGAIASWVINQYFRGVKCLAQGHNTAAVGLEPRTSRSGVRHSTTEPPRSPQCMEVRAHKKVHAIKEVQILHAFLMA